jgi:hypothetical protein
MVDREGRRSPPQRLPELAAGSPATTDGGLSNLVIVTGHAIYLGTHGDPSDDRDWFLQDYERGEPSLLIEHIHAGVDIAAADPAALIVFSGGQSRRAAGPRSEALGYWLLADHFGWWGASGVEPRATTEEYATDSFQNLLFSLCRYREWTGGFPDHVHLVSWEFKRRRFELIRRALGFPEDRFTFVGANQPPNPTEATRGEESALAAIDADPYCTGDVLRRKRIQRNPFSRTPPYEVSCPELAGLLRHGGPDLFRGDLPWR